MRTAPPRPSKLLASLGKAAEAMEEQKNYTSTPEELTAALAVFNQKYDFKPGDIVDFKPGMKGPGKDGPYIVVEVLQSPIINPEEDSSSADFREPLDIILGRTFKDGTFMRWHWDSRRFQPYNA